jgi:hypothetical protein
LIFDCLTASSGRIGGCPCAKSSIQSSYVAGPRPAALANRYLTTASTSRDERQPLPAGGMSLPISPRACPYQRLSAPGNAVSSPETRPRRPLSATRRASCSWKRVRIDDIARPYLLQAQTYRWTRCFGCRLVGRSLPHGPIKRGMSQRCQGSKHLVANTKRLQAGSGHVGFSQGTPTVG